MAIGSRGHVDGEPSATGDLFGPEALPPLPLSREELEIKYSVDANQLPQDLLDALINGSEHEDIARKGRITQLYLPVTKSTLHLAVKILQRIGELNGKPIIDPVAEHFRNPDNVSEIRILRREQDHIGPSEEYMSYLEGQDAALACPDAFQITIKGHESDNGDRRSVLETPITDGPEVAQGVVDLLESLRTKKDGHPVKLSWQSKVKRLDKMWYDIRIPDPFNSGEHLTVELDFFPDLGYFAIAEIEFPDAPEKIELFRQNHLPQWFHSDLTSHTALRSRALAGETAETLAGPLAEIVGSVRDRLERLYQPTVLGNQVFLDDNASGKSFVVLGSFKRFLPQFARIGDDLARQSSNVFPRINTLDVARRRLSAENAEDDSFRIEALEDLPLSVAELHYLRQIRESDAVYVVCPEGRLGGTSTQEMVYAFGSGKSVYFATKPDRVSESVPWQIRAIVDIALLEIVAGTPHEVTDNLHFPFQNHDFGPHVRHYFSRATGGNYSSIVRMLRYNLFSCILEISRAERRQANDGEQTVMGLNPQLDLFRKD